MVSGAEKDSHGEVPIDPSDGDRFICPRCGYTAEFVVLDDGLHGEWVSVTPPGLREGGE